MCTDNATYVGATVDLNRRLRQHNGEIKGGAHATTSKVKKREDMESYMSCIRFPRLECDPPVRMAVEATIS